MEPTILHADLDAFYASVEQLLDPSLRGIPVAVGGGVILAASYEARSYGVRVPMPVGEARKLCPMLRVVDGHFSRYMDFSEQVMEIVDDFTPVVEQISVDEAFLDVLGTIHIFGPPSQIASQLRRRVRDEVGLPISIGVASTKFLAKIASARAKPDGLVVVDPSSELDFLHALPVEAMWGVGPVTARRLRSMGIFDIGQLAAVPEGLLGTNLGSVAGSSLYALANNRDPRPVLRGRRAGSVGSQQALGRGLTEVSAMQSVVGSLADRVGRRLRRKERAGSTITVRLRFPGPKRITRSRTLRWPTASTRTISTVAAGLLEKGIEAGIGPVTLIGISVSNLQTDRFVQLELGFDWGELTSPGSRLAARNAALDERVDQVRDRFGSNALQLGRVGDMSVEDDFRRLAERS
ncbi:MAG TPA: DNA polymerase IV [Acidimicrobiia bacterium]